jgi:type IV pilus assembly protein PilN
MTRINLLPWREEARKRRRVELGIAAGIAAALTLAGAVVVHLRIDTQIDAQLARNRLLETEIARLNTQLEEIQELDKVKSDLVSRMEIIQQLQVSRPEIVRMFDELVILMPSGVYLTRLEQTGRSVIIEGRAQSNAGVSALMRAIESSQWIGNPHLLLIESQDKTGTGLNHFRLRFDQTGLREDADQGERATKKSGPV